MMTESTLSPREQLREQIKERLVDITERIEGGPMDGTEYVRVANLATLLSEPLEPASARSTELRAPGGVTVYAECPMCGLTAGIALAVGVELRTDAEGSSIHLKGKSRAATHQCNQEVAFDLSDIVEPIDDDTTPEES
jgi:hypothetical protein